ncbi:MAG TPA: RIP metalloprotease RseP [Vicinamibacterales bacterium]|nr:RIP metalloprotease RseP [Acidobacteriota bacterium]HOC19769.1 RIP metalloprotease RseP [Vicinamibacterales bacterium]
MLTTILAFVFVLGVLIFVHELGHFIAARRIGIRVITFSLGFGPKVFSFRRGDTEYAISAVPLGGYVKMAGESPDDPRSGKDDEFLSKSKWQRFQVLIMGPAMNVLLAIVLMWVVLLQGAQVPAFIDEPPVIGSVAEGSPAERAGIERGDRIVRVSGREVATWEDLSIAIGTKANREVPVELVRDDRTITVRVTPDPQTKYEVGDIGVFPDVHPSVLAVVKGDPADRAGMQPGDVVLAVNGQPMSVSQQLSNAIAAHPGEQITVTVRRDGETRDVLVTPEKRGAKGIIGISIGEELKTIDPGPLEALQMSLQRNYEFGGLIFRTLGGLLTRETSPKQLMGPVAIAQLSGEYAAAGFIALLSLMASISLNLGILNLLPIPVLDGGHIFIMAIEGLARRDLSMKVKEQLLLAGFFLLMILMVTVIYNDLTRIQWVERLMFWR